VARRSIGFPLVVGVVLLLLVLALAVGWQVLLVSDVRIASRGLSGLDWVLLVLGGVFFLLVIVGLVWLCAWLIREMRTNQRQRAFLDAVTHEMRTPLASLRLYLDTIVRHDPEPEQRRQFLRACRRRAARPHRAAGAGGRRKSLAGAPRWAGAALDRAARSASGDPQPPRAARTRGAAERRGRRRARRRHRAGGVFRSLLRRGEVLRDRSRVKVRVEPLGGRVQVEIDAASGSPPASCARSSSASGPDATCSTAAGWARALHRPQPGEAPGRRRGRPQRGPGKAAASW
jgi:signal transduction histidine kinase